MSRERLRLAGWTILASNAPARLLSQAEALVLYRARWQIERLFRLWKEVGEIDGGPGWRSQKAERILCEVYAKLLGQIVEHWVILSSGGWQDESRSLHQMAQTVQKHALIMASALGRFGDLRRLEHALEVIGFCLTSGCQVNTRKKKPSLAQLLRDPFLSCFP